MEFPIDLDCVPAGHPHAWGLMLSITTIILDMAVLKALRYGLSLAFTQTSSNH